MLSSTLLKTKKAGTKKMPARYISDLYSFKQVMRYLSKVKRLSVGDNDNLIPNQTLKYIDDLVLSLEL